MVLDFPLAHTYFVIPYQLKLSCLDCISIAALIRFSFLVIYLIRLLPTPHSFAAFFPGCFFPSIMNFFGSGPTKKAVVRKVAVSVPTKKTTTAPSTPRTTSSPAPRSGKVAPTSRKGSRLQVPKTTSKRIVKRKASTPPPQWSNDDNDSGSDGSEVSFDSARKRVRSSASSVEPSRILADTSNRLQDDGGIYELAHAADLVSGEHSLLFLPAFVEEIATEIELQYPSASQRERYVSTKRIQRP